MSNIRSRLLCVSPSISCWEARKQDKKATRETEEKHAVAHGSVRTHKDLLPGAVEHENIIKIRNGWRIWMTENSLPWAPTVQVVRSEKFFEFSEGYREWAEKFDSACSVFYAAYPTLIAQAELRLNTLHDPNDYPPLEEIKRRFGHSLKVFPLPNADDFRIMDGISPEEAEAMRLEALNGLQEQVNDALKDLWGRMSKVVVAMQERLSIPHGEKGGKFHDTLVENIRDIVDKVPTLNLTGDVVLTQVAKEMEDLLVAPDALRTDPDLRAAKAAKAKLLAERMSTYIGD